MARVALCFGTFVVLLIRLPLVAGPGRAATPTQTFYHGNISHTGDSKLGYIQSSMSSVTVPFEFRLLSDVVRGIYWSAKVERICPAGFSENKIKAGEKKISDGNFVNLTEGCGRMQNRQLTLQDSSKVCARYRPNIDQIQGEIYSYHLAKILGIANLPPTVMFVVKHDDPRYELVKEGMVLSRWADGKFVILTEWIEDLGAANIPKEFQDNTRQLVPSENLLNKSFSELCELLQWSDLIIFDYLTANLDRVVNNMFNQQWNSNMMTKPVHNLHKDRTSGRLVFLDNESGLLHGYRNLDKYASYHEVLLESLCIFRESTVEAIENFLLANNLGEELQNSLVVNEKYHKYLPKLPENNIKILERRLLKVYDKMQRCRMQYGER